MVVIHNIIGLALNQGLSLEDFMVLSFFCFSSFGGLHFNNLDIASSNVILFNNSGGACDFFFVLLMA
jgi:hypothetical protein